MIHKIPLKVALKMMKYWPPYFGSGVSIESMNDDLTEIVVKMPLTKLNANYVGTHFGGSLYSMCDPFYMLMLLHHMKENHVVWDQAAKIEFIKPGKGTVRAKFQISHDEINDFRKQALESFSLRPVFHCEVRDSDDEVVAKVEKHLYIRRKDAKERFSKKEHSNS
ncbi:MAG: DUF4442 domain-containing protein [Bacteriovoracaceae bacterium]